MKIAITGCGKVGTTLAGKLSKEKYDVIVIDKEEKKLQYVNDTMDVLCICGDAASADTLLSANIGTCDLFIAMTNSDETNILSCHLAKRLGVERTIARVRNPQLARTVELIKSDTGISMSINPDLDAAKVIYRALRFRNAEQVETFAKGMTEVITFVVKDDSPICNTRISDLQNKTKTKVFACGIKRNGEVFIPNGDTVIMAGDTMSFVASGKDSYTFFKKIGYDPGSVKNLTIIGGGRLGYFVGKLAVENGIPVTIIDKNEEVCNSLSNRLPSADILCGDAMDTNFLEEEDILNSAAVATLTGNDPVNVMVSMFVHKNSPDSKVITKIKSSDFEEMLFNLDVGIIVNPKYIAADNVLRYVKAIENVLAEETQSMCHIMDNKVAVMEFLLSSTAVNTGIKLKDLKFKKNIMITQIIRGGRPFIPGGNDTMEVGDVVLVVTTQESITCFADIFA
ncbi:MAG: Trk system potassium transporter TrkA [Lachnospiraceae bacterium]|nr:Trk system potassium transporter TrkA [Lachnospiraceae bacterium]